MLSSWQNLIIRKFERLEALAKTLFTDATEILTNAIVARLSFVKWFMNVLTKHGMLEPDADMVITHIEVDYETYKVTKTTETLHVKRIYRDRLSNVVEVILDHEERSNRPRSCCFVHSDKTVIYIDNMFADTVIFKDYTSEDALVKNVRGIIERELRSRLPLPCEIVNYFVLADFIVKNLDIIFDAVNRLEGRPWR